MPEAVIHWLLFHCTRDDVTVEMRTRQPDDNVWALARRRGIACPRCGKAMGKRAEGKRTCAPGETGKGLSVAGSQLDS